MALVDSLRKVASKAYSTFGTTITVRIISQTSYNTATGKIINATTDSEVKGIIEDVFDGTGARSQMRDKTEKNAILQVGDKKLTIAAADVTTTPNSKDRILVGSNSLQIVDIKTTELNGKAITYELFLRG